MPEAIRYEIHTRYIYSEGGVYYFDSLEHAQDAYNTLTNIDRGQGRIGVVLIYGYAIYDVDSIERVELLAVISEANFDASY